MKKNVDKAEFENYLRETRTWETDKVKKAQSEKKTAWLVAGTASVVALMASVTAITMAFAWMNPAPPPVIRVDNATGIVDMVETVSDGKTNYEEVVNKYFTQLYVRYREGYSRELADQYYMSVGLMSSGREQKKYYEWFGPKIPLSPLNVYGNYAKVRTNVQSTSFIKPNVALVRYTKEIERGSSKPEISHWAATIVFKYSGAPMTESERAINPLGFQVVEYRNDPDAYVQESPFKQPGTAQAQELLGTTAFANPTTAPAAVTLAVPAIQ